MPFLPYIIAGLLAYLLGSVPFGLLVARARGVDIRAVGSRNIGATNVFRCVGRPWGILTFALDFLKGLIGATLVPCIALRLIADEGASAPTLALVGGAAAVIGHTWPIFAGFKGGKGVATGFGMLVAITPAAVGIAFGAWLVVMAVSRYVSLSSVTAAAVLAALVWIPRFCGHLPSSIVISVIAAVVIVRHRSNICRLINGTEARFSFTAAQKAREEARRAERGIQS
ncbi:MAG: glycerol-3-phosphate 1-O-acyltransferase PlsY [Kiritimatiellae bacterium]|nr:glycerol-3-phosphate 1-O-acyltransferase PlsY [Kiritimatiellia bacterium]